jgi:murein DD-endopeptidase MepM/ murein hydrolase activator NlpD
MCSDEWIRVLSMPGRLLFIALIVLLIGGCGSRGVYHTVMEGQTLYRIGQAYGVDEKKLARLNGISDPTQLRIGERLYIPGADQVKPVPRTVFPPPSGSTAAAVSRAPDGGGRKPPKTTQTTSPSPPAPTQSPGRSGAVKGKFLWPVKGEITRGFGLKDGELCQGVRIAVPRGTVVKSAASGRVTFSGDQIAGYGNLVILKHEDSYFTVYGMNDRNLVEVGSQVKKGEQIALSGTLLHFEIHRGKEPVNPIFYLP